MKEEKVILAPIETKAIGAVGNTSLKEERFIDDLRNTLTGTVNECEAYSLLCRNRHFNPDIDLTTMEDAVRIPYITSQAFKKSVGLFPKLLRIPVSEIDLWTASSSTRGDPSLSGRRWEDVGTYQLAYLSLFSRLFGNEPFDTSLVFWPDPAVMKARSGNLYGKPVEPFALYIIQSERVTHDPQKLHYLMQPNKETLRMEINLPILLDRLREAVHSKERTLLIGSTPLLYLTLKDHYDRTGETFDLGSNGYLLPGAGGWDGKKGQVNISRTISKEAFVSDMTRILGIPPEHITDRYGFSESSTMLPGCYDADLRDFVYEVPPWAHALVRDPNTLEPISEYGKEGLLELITPYGMSTHAGAAVLVDDLVSLVEPTNSKISGTAIRIHGRVPHSHKAGCGVMFE
ncbi:hypothetical protein [Cohnella pontilimi]|uniref:LuxE/PaaK family acyltransferase n=1 Tax=Cohnella pontilimi TaxID=2564100 RepID=UPI00145F17E3|nr:hypothetical protein [Cohnella pontilimi]